MQTWIRIAGLIVGLITAVDGVLRFVLARRILAALGYGSDTATMTAKAAAYGGIGVGLLEIAGAILVATAALGLAQMMDQADETEQAFRRIERELALLPDRLKK
jgi:hypothetical protein